MIINGGLISLHINDNNDVVASYANGTNVCIGSPTSERGAKMILAKRAKMLDLVKSADGRSAQ